MCLANSFELFPLVWAPTVYKSVLTPTLCLTPWDPASSSWLIPLAIAMGMSMAYLTLVFFIGVILDRDDLRDYAKVEISELLFTVLIVILVGVGLNALCSMGIFEELAEKMDTLKGVLLTLLMNLMIINEYLLFVSSYVSEISAHGAKIVLSFAGLKDLVTLINSAIAPYTLLVALTVSYMGMIEISGILSFKYFIPAGIVLRAFPPTKRVGGALLGLGIVLGLIFPLFLKVFLDIVDEVFGLQALVAKTTLMLYGLFTGPLGVAVLKGLLQKVLFRVFAQKTFKGLGQVVVTVGKYAAAGGVLSVLSEAGTSLLFRMCRAGAFLFLLNFVLGVLGVSFFLVLGKEITGLIGEKMDISSITRLI